MLTHSIITDLLGRAIIVKNINTDTSPTIVSYYIYLMHTGKWYDISNACDVENDDMVIYRMETMTRTSPLVPPLLAPIDDYTETLIRDSYLYKAIGDNTILFNYREHNICYVYNHNTYTGDFYATDNKGYELARFYTINEVKLYIDKILDDNEVK